MGKWIIGCTNRIPRNHCKECEKANNCSNKEKMANPMKYTPKELNGICWSWYCKLDGYKCGYHHKGCPTYDHKIRFD